MPVFRRQAVIDADHAKSGGIADLGADVIVTVQPADHETATMKIHYIRGGRAGLIDPHRHASQHHVLRGDAFGAARVKSPAHPVIDGALLVGAEPGRVLGVVAGGPFDERPGFCINQVGVIDHSRASGRVEARA